MTAWGFGVFLVSLPLTPHLLLISVCDDHWFGRVQGEPEWSVPAWSSSSRRQRGRLEPDKAVDTKAHTDQHPIHGSGHACVDMSV